MRKKGITLIALVMIIVLLGIITGGIVSYISEGLRFSVSNTNNTKAFYMAQAGLNSGIVDFKNDGLWSKSSNTNVAGEFYYQLGQDANFLFVDASSPMAAGINIQGVPFKNINAVSVITVTDMIVDWSFGGNITQVKLAGNVAWSGTAVSPATLNITDTVFAAGVNYSGTPDQLWKFSNAASGSFDLIVTFNFSDGSFFKTYIVKNGLSGNKEFSLKATGEVRNGAEVLARRTLVATYDTGTSKITSWEESQEHIIP